MQKARRCPCGLRQLVDIRFQVLFHSPLGVLFTFPSRYCYTIGHMRVFSLTRWSWRIQTEFLVIRPTWVGCKRVLWFSVTGLSPSMAEPFLIHLPNHRIFDSPEQLQLFQASSHNTSATKLAGMTLHRFGLIPVRSPLLRESLLFSVPEVTEMFHFSSFPLITLYIQVIVPGHYSGRVVPFGNPRFYGCLHLPEAYRSLPRPSSSSYAEASPVRPYYLEQSLIYIK